MRLPGLGGINPVEPLVEHGVIAVPVDGDLMVTSLDCLHLVRAPPKAVVKKFGPKKIYKPWVYKPKVVKPVYKPKVVKPVYPYYWRRPVVVTSPSTVLYSRPSVTVTKTVPATTMTASTAKPVRVTKVLDETVKTGKGKPEDVNSRFDKLGGRQKKILRLTKELAEKMKKAREKMKTMRRPH